MELTTLSKQETFKKLAVEYNLPAYVTSQINQAIYKQGVKSYAEITTISKELRQELTHELGSILTLTKVAESTDEQAQKILFETRDGLRIESVHMTYKPTTERQTEHHALCVSSQVGCTMGCKFCATGALGFNRNLTADEIVDQLLYFKQQQITIDTVFFSGMGEPFANPALFDALTILTAKDCFNLSQRKISISTIGLIPGIKRLTKEFPQINLAFSLHSPFTEQRTELMPINKAYSIDEVFKTLNEHIAETNRKVFVAYILLEEVNDTMKHANALVQLIKKQGKKAYLYHVNLIRFHPGPTIEGFKRPATDRVDNFKRYLTEHGVSCTLRQSFGIGIDAACGQLFARYSKTQPINATPNTDNTKLNDCTN